MNYKFAQRKCVTLGHTTFYYTSEHWVEIMPLITGTCKCNSKNKNLRFIIQFTLYILGTVHLLYCALRLLRKKKVCSIREKWGNTLEHRGAAPDGSDPTLMTTFKGELCCSIYYGNWRSPPVYKWLSKQDEFTDNLPHKGYTHEGVALISDDVGEQCGAEQKITKIWPMK